MRVAHAINRGFHPRQCDAGLLGEPDRSAAARVHDAREHRTSRTTSTILPRRTRFSTTPAMPRRRTARASSSVFFGPTNDIRITKMADVIRQNLSDVGIAVSLQPLERAALNQKGYISEQFDMIIDSYAQGPDPDIGTERLYISNNIHNPPRIFTNNSLLHQSGGRQAVRRAAPAGRSRKAQGGLRPYLGNRLGGRAGAADPRLFGRRRVPQHRDDQHVRIGRRQQGQLRARRGFPRRFDSGRSDARQPRRRAPSQRRQAAAERRPTAIAAAGAAVVAAGAYWLWRRKSRADLDDGLDETRS